jgi:hypothetical protein
MPKFIDLTGQVFGRLTVIGFAEKRKALSYWRCKCDCGNERAAYAGHLKSGHTASCGCIHREVVTTHGMAKSLTYKIWQSMIQRCANSKDRCYPDYGGRGITVCDRWLNSFESFIEDMGERPSKDHSIDRIDNGKGYSPDNCRWATRKEQQRNRRSNRWVNVEGCAKTVAEWGEITGQDCGTIRSRLRLGWSDYDSVMGK